MTARSRLRSTAATCPSRCIVRSSRRPTAASRCCTGISNFVVERSLERAVKIWASYKAFESSLGASLASQVKGALFTAKARHYDSALQAALDGGNVPEPVYRSLIAETNRGLPVLHRYFELRRRAQPGARCQDLGELQGVREFAWRVAGLAGEGRLVHGQGAPL